MCFQRGTPLFFRKPRFVLFAVMGNHQLSVSDGDAALGRGAAAHPFLGKR